MFCFQFCMMIRKIENNLNFTQLKTTNLTQKKNNIDNKDSSKKKKVIATLVGMSVLGIALISLAKKPKLPPIKAKEVVKPDEPLLIEPKIKKIIQDARINNEDVNPLNILHALQENKLISNLKEENFAVRKDSKITAGRKFSFLFTSSVTKKRYNMIFEVHDYNERNNKRNWVMRLYDLDFKNQRSYLVNTGGLKVDSYLSSDAHINCGEYGRNFVLGNIKI